MDVVVDGVVVNVDFCARHDIHTGIHRVVRETLPRWAAGHDFVATANVDSYTALRTLAPREHRARFEYGGTHGVDREAEQAYRARLVVPWRGVLVIPEIPDPAFGPSLAGLAELSGNALSRDRLRHDPRGERGPAARRGRACGSAATSRWSSTPPASPRSASRRPRSSPATRTPSRPRACPGRTSARCRCPGDVPPVDEDAPDTGRRRQVLCVGSHEPHKNHDTVLHAAERLWREGLDFELVLIGGPGWQSEAFEQRLEKVQASGRPVVVRGRVDDATLWRAFREAEFSVFVSLHEGFGLPVVESLACGTPVVTTAYGSMGEIAAERRLPGGRPAGRRPVTGAMRGPADRRRLLERLRREARARPPRTWDDYAAELWDALAPARKVAP